MTDDYVERLRANRREKDEFFAEHPQSPIPPEHRDGFDGLSYFDPDPDYRAAALVTVHDEPEPVTMETTAGPEVRYLRVATFSFELRGEPYELHAYQQETNDDGTLFVPFRDKTTGQQTYRHGRYMELEPEDGSSAGDDTERGSPEDRLGVGDGDTVTVDFNLAYNPFCAFSETFSCPLPPEENWLETTIPAGEKTIEL